MSKTKRRRKNTSKDESFIKYLYCIIIIVLSIIVLSHEYTGFLGGFLYRVFFYLFGKLWFIPPVVLSLYFLLDAFNLRLNAKFYISTVLLFAALLMIMSAISVDRKAKGIELIKNYFASTKLIFYDNLDVCKGGLLGIILYGLIAAITSFWGVMIVIIVLFVVAVMIHYPDIKERLDSPKMAARKPAKTEKVDKRKEIDLFDFADEIENKIKVSKPKKGILSFDKKPKEEPVKKQPVQKEEPIRPVVINTEVKTNNKEVYNMPSLSYLDASAVSKNNVNKRNAAEKWEILSEILDSFDLNSSLAGYNIGPSVTQFEIVPNGSFNINKYTNIASNIKMGLAVRDVRIEAPIPGKRAVGIEIPNEEPTIVRLKELLKDVPDKYQYEPLMIAVGKDLAGNGVYGLINKMPHMLIAGATGSGKSVCINSIILTLLLRTRPDEVKLLLIDPKKVEFSAYANIPHLICPIINDTDKAASALNKLIRIMEQRYDSFANCGAKNIAEYNSKNPDKKMYNIVCIIDELADLMATHGKEVEGSIHRLASLARASGIFMILATQRPSTDVITGTIKANIVSRIAFAVTSSYDSRTILDQTGAEALLGNGDMLYNPAGAQSPIRVQGVYCSDEEISRVVEYFNRSGYKPNYADIFVVEDEDESGNMISADINDPLYHDIEKWVITQKAISASGLQRRYGLGFPRAAKIIDALEQNGIISASNGSKPRDVLVHTDDEEM